MNFSLYAALRSVRHTNLINCGGCHNHCFHKVGIRLWRHCIHGQPLKVIVCHIHLRILKHTSFVHSEINHTDLIQPVRNGGNQSEWFVFTDSRLTGCELKFNWLPQFQAQFSVELIFLCLVANLIHHFHAIGVVTLASYVKTNNR